METDPLPAAEALIFLEKAAADRRLVYGVERLLNTPEGPMLDVLEILDFTAAGRLALLSDIPDAIAFVHRLAVPATLFLITCDEA